MELEQEIITAFENAAGPMRPGDLADALKADKKEIEKAIKKMKDAGTLHSPKRCFYDIHR